MKIVFNGLKWLKLANSHGLFAKCIIKRQWNLMVMRLGSLSI